MSEPFDSKYKLFKEIGVPFSGMSKQHNTIPLVNTLEKVREGCEMYMNQLDNDGHCEDADDYVVALAFFDDYIEKIKSEEEKEAMREGEWNRDPYDHIEENERCRMLAEDEQFIRNSYSHETKLGLYP